MMKASDLYPNAKAKTTEQETKATENQSQKKAASKVASGSKLGNTYGTMALLAIAGILIGAKFALEKS